MEPLTKAAGIAEGDGLKKVLRLGLNPATIRGISRFAGLPGLAISTAMPAYDQYENTKMERDSSTNYLIKSEPNKWLQ